MTGLRTCCATTVACLALLTGCAAAQPADGVAPAAQAASPPASAAPAATPTTVTSEQAATALAASGLDGAELHAVDAGGAGMVAVGAREGAAAAWTSADDGAWQEVALREAGSAGALQAVATADGRGVAFGAPATGPSHAWSVTPGADPWERTGAEGIDGRVNAVAAGDGRWVAAGDRIDTETGGTASGAVWTSTGDGSWRTLGEVSLDEGTLSDVVVAGGTVVVVGFDVNGGKVWTGNADGDLEAVGGGTFDAATIQGVAHTGDGYVALGQSLADLRPLVWTSPDGTSWTRTEVPADAFPPDLQINDLAAVDGTLVAVGAGPEGGVVWTSQDGASWTLRS